MKLKKALKTLKSKGTGFVFNMKQMEQHYNPEKFVEEIQTYGYCLFYDNIDSTDFCVKPFKLFGSGYPYQYIDFIELEESDLKTIETEDNWGYYSFMYLHKLFNCTIPINFGIHSVVHKSIDSSISLYHT